jgi:polyketide biosynthesis acyl carrier protein
MTQNEIFELIAKHTKEVVPELENYDFKLTDSLKKLGANSIDRTELMTMMMESMGLDIPRIDLFGAQNIGELVEIFYAKTQSTS